MNTYVFNTQFKKKNIFTISGVLAFTLPSHSVFTPFQGTANFKFRTYSVVFKKVLIKYT